MNHSAVFIFHLVGTLILVLGVVLHVVCMATNYFVEADMDDFGMKLADKIRKDPSIIGADADKLTEQEIKDYVAASGGMPGGSMNFGMWKLCVNSGPPSDEHLCVGWGTETSFNKETGKPTAFKSDHWIRAVQAMAIIGLFLATVAVGLAILNLAVKSKGDRLKLLYLIVCFTCEGAALFILIGDLIVAGNYRDVLEPLADAGTPLVPPKVYDLVKDQLALSWGYALDVVAVPLCVLAGIAHLLGGRLAIQSGVV